MMPMNLQYGPGDELVGIKIEVSPGEWRTFIPESRLDQLEKHRERAYEDVAAISVENHSLKSRLDNRDETIRLLELSVTEMKARLAAIKPFIERAAEADGIATMRGWLINLIQNFKHWEREDDRVVERRVTNCTKCGVDIANYTSECGEPGCPAPLG